MSLWALSARIFIFRMGFHLYLLSFMGFPASVSVQLYSPRRPAVDVAEVFLWLMAVGTILCASYWSAWNAREAAIEHDKLLKVLSCISFADYNPLPSPKRAWTILFVMNRTFF